MRRKTDGGNTIILDLSGNVYIHGLPDDDIEWELDYGAPKAEKKRLAASSRCCEACGHVYPKTEPQCPLCGVAPLKNEVLELDTEVKEVDGDSVPPRPKPTKRTLTKEIIETGGDLGKLQDLRRKYAYHSNWPRRMQQVYRFAWPKEAS